MGAKAIQKRLDSLRQSPVKYQPNGNVKFPVTSSQLLREQRDAAIKLLAKWVAAIISGDDWQPYYRQAAHDSTEPPELRKLIDEELKKC